MFLSEQAEVNMVGFFGADVTENNCVNANYWSTGILACEFKLKAGGDNFGMLFSGGFIPVFYTVEWKLAENWAPAFNWW